MQRSKITQCLSSLAAIGLLLIGSPISAQQTTERYIPIGQSPGASNIYTYIGTIVAVDAERRTITVEDSQGRHEIRVSDATDIWLDNSANERANATASFADCEIGRKVEIMHRRDDEYAAAWIKIAGR